MTAWFTPLPPIDETEIFEAARDIIGAFDALPPHVAMALVEQLARDRRSQVLSCIGRVFLHEERRRWDVALTIAFQINFLVSDSDIEDLIETLADEVEPWRTIRAACEAAFTSWRAQRPASRSPRERRAMHAAMRQRWEQEQIEAEEEGG